MQTKHNIQNPILYYDSKQLAERLGLKLDTVEKWRQHDVGPPWIKIGKLVRYHVETVEKWLSEQTHVPRPRKRRAKGQAEGGVK